jgi:hypothetical protein
VLHRRRVRRLRLLYPAIDYTSLDQSVLFEKGQSLDGGAVLPGFVLPLNEHFAKDEP